MMVPVYLFILLFGFLENMENKSILLFRRYLPAYLILSIALSSFWVFKFYYNGSMNTLTNQALYKKDFRKKIRAVIPDYTNKVISIPDELPNYTLFFCNQKGVSNYGFTINNEEMIHSMIKKGYGYLIVNDTNYYKSCTVLQKFEGEKLMDDEGVRVYKLQSNK